MKSWQTAAFPGRCAFDYAHRWKAGDRFFRLYGPWSKPKSYCSECAARHGAGEDTGEPAEAPVRAFAPLKALASSVRFDAKAAQSGRDE